MRCRHNKRLSCVVFAEYLPRARLIAGPGFTWKNICVARRQSALREKRRENKTEACGAGGWKTGNTETPHHYCHPHLRDLAQATSCHWRLFMSELGKDQSTPCLHPEPFDNRWSLQWCFVATATAHRPIKPHRCPLLFVPRIVRAISCST